MNHVLDWLVNSEEPWTRYCTRVGLLGQPESDPRVCQARADMLAHPLVLGLINEVQSWPGYPLQRHNDANHPLHKLGVLVDFGLTAHDPGIPETLSAIQSHFAPQGSLQTLIRMNWGTAAQQGDFWTWMACDAPLLLHALIGLSGLELQALASTVTAPALAHLLSLAADNGWPCVVAPELGKFRGPGRKTDPCPIATVYALQALSLCPDLLEHPAARSGVEMLLAHWAQRKAHKYYLFGMGTDFARLKYPLVWYDVLHVVDVLSRFPVARGDARLGEMRAVIKAQANEAGYYTAGSMYLAWKGWSFADKKKPSPWLTFKVLQTMQRAQAL